MTVSEAAYQRLVMQDRDHTWELVCGQLLRKPLMTMEHNYVPRRLARRFIFQLSEDAYVVSETAKLRTPSGSYRNPDLAVIPIEYVERFRLQPGSFEVFDDAVPFVLEVWSESTGDYDVSRKLSEYQERGDAELWYAHPYAHTLAIYRRRLDGSYDQWQHSGGPTDIPSLGGIVINVDELWA